MDLKETVKKAERVTEKKAEKNTEKNTEKNIEGKITDERVEALLREKGYTPKEFLGQGATAFVWLVETLEGGRKYACKISSHKQWLIPEAELTDRLEHPLFPEGKEWWESGAYVFFVMEYIEGNSLQTMMNTGKRGMPRLTVQESLRIALELADGLGYLHDLDPPVIYRDLKPDNILLQPDGRVRLIDLGAAAVPTGWRAGTPGYAAPEQRIEPERYSAYKENGKGKAPESAADNSAPGQAPGPAADIYALGTLLQQLLKGQRIERRLPELLERCTRADPRERIPGMHELIKELSRFYSLHNRKGRFRVRTLIRKYVKSGRIPVYYKNIWESSYKIK